MHGATLERLYDCVLACRVVSRGHVPLYAIVATSWLWLCRALDVVAVVAVRHVVAVAVVPWPWRPPSFCRCRVVATRRWMLVFAMVLVVSVLSWFAI